MMLDSELAKEIWLDARKVAAVNGRVIATKLLKWRNKYGKDLSRALEDLKK